MSIELKIADESHTDLLLPMVRDYHEYEQITLSDKKRKDALRPLLNNDASLGRIWLIYASGKAIGYIAICFGYSIEFGGRDAFVDELFIEEQARGKGTGYTVLKAIKEEAEKFDIEALHLEVAKTNSRAKRLYEKSGFKSRENFHLMSWKRI